MPRRQGGTEISAAFRDEIGADIVAEIVAGIGVKFGAESYQLDVFLYY